MVEGAQERVPALCAVRFDSGFHSPENRVRLAELLEHGVLPKKGYPNRAERERTRDEEFVAMCRQHPAVESAINNLEHRGLDRVLAYGADGFAGGRCRWWLSTFIASGCCCADGHAGAAPLDDALATPAHGGWPAARREGTDVA